MAVSELTAARNSAANSSQTTSLSLAVGGSGIVNSGDALVVFVAWYNNNGATVTVSLATNASITLQDSAAWQGSSGGTNTFVSQSAIAWRM